MVSGQRRRAWEEERKDGDIMDDQTNQSHRKTQRELSHNITDRELYINLEVLLA